MTWSPTPGQHRDLPSNWATIRREVFERDDYQCQIRGPRCTVGATEVDHVGGKLDHDLDNLRAACRPCHAQRSAGQGHDAMRAIRANGKHSRPRRHPGLID